MNLSPPALSTIISYGPPLILFFLGAYFFWASRRPNASADSAHSLDNTIEFEWGRAPIGLVVPPDGKYYELTLAPVPVDMLKGGPATARVRLLGRAQERRRFPIHLAAVPTHFALALAGDCGGAPR